MIGDYDFLPCTPAGVMELLNEYNIDPSGRSVSLWDAATLSVSRRRCFLLHKNGTVTVCHSRTKDLKEVTLRADILVVAIGKGEFITGDMIKEGAVVIDVGMNRNSAGKLVGDVHFESAAAKASYITPVPGGVGPMTRAVLMKNTVRAAQINAK